jgi:hypothetical protein
MYTGSLTYQAFGNDTTTGSTPKFSQAGFSAFPFNANCHVGPYHAKETVKFETSGGDDVVFTLPKYGGQALVHDTNGDGTLNVAAGCLDASIELGAPMYAQGATLSTTGMSTTSRTSGNPRGIDIGAGEFTAMQFGKWSLASYGPYAFDVQYTDLSNEPGTFRDGGGIGNFTWTERTGMAQTGWIKHGKVVVAEGPNQFGGTMKMLGTFFSNEGFYYKGHLSVAKFTWLFQYHGAGAITSLYGDVSQPGIVSKHADIYTTLNGNTYLSRVFGKMFSWTTGTVSVTATHGPFPTVLARHGFDNRNAAGSGEIQMVTPMITRWVWLAGNYETASIGHLRLSLTPEPQEWMMLGAGISMLGLLYRSNRRSH